jgi:hypothetical protein
MGPRYYDPQTAEYVRYCVQTEETPEQDEPEQLELEIEESNYE